MGSNNGTSHEEHPRVETDEEYAEKLIAVKQAKVDPMVLKWIPATSNVVERLISRVNYLFNSYRKNLNPPQNHFFWETTANVGTLNINSTRIVTVQVLQKSDKATKFI